jgi:NAD(P)-dependent dehydrogenase (short-subunit alcohol dehydrogenase family)
MNEDGAKEIAEKINGIAVAADVSNEQDIINVIEKANKYSGGIDIFCSNAGISGTPMLLETTAEEWNNTWGVNVMSHVHAARHVLPQMLEQGEGYLMNTASAAGLLSQIGAAQYAVTKSAAVSFAEWVKITYGHKGIGVSCLCPQAVRTAMTAQGAGVAGVDGMLEPDVVAKDVLDAIENERFLVLPHKEVGEYVQRKGNDRDRWITGMQRLQKQYEDFYENWVNTNKGEKE